MAKHKPEKSKSLDQAAPRQQKQTKQFPSETRAMANMNLIIHHRESQIEISDAFKNPKFHSKADKLRIFDRFPAEVQPKTRHCKILLVNASQVFEKVDPSRVERERLPKPIQRVKVPAFISNFIPHAGIQRTANRAV